MILSLSFSSNSNWPRQECALSNSAWSVVIPRSLLWSALFPAEKPACLYLLKLTLRTKEVVARLWHYTSEWSNSLFILLILWLSVDRMWSDVLMYSQPLYRYTTHCQQQAHMGWSRETVFAVGVKWKPKSGKVQHALERSMLASRLSPVLEKNDT